MPAAVHGRSWRIGMSTMPPRPDVGAFLTGIDQWSQRAEIGAIHEQLPWKELLAGVSPDAILERDKLQLVNYLRAKQLQVYLMVDPNDGLSRGEDALDLRSAGRSLAEPAIQQLYLDYVHAVAARLRPDYLGLAAETNLVRAAAPAALYDAVVLVANRAHAELRSAGFGGWVLTTAQVETAWGVLGSRAAFVGIAADRRDFAFSQVLGLSSYPQFGFDVPEAIPADYYSRLTTGSSLPAMVLEGGWTSQSTGPFVSSPAIQARYIARHADLLDSVHARALVQLFYADLDLAAYPGADVVGLQPFAHLGLTDSSFMPKPALAAWDGLFARPLTA